MQSRIQAQWVCSRERRIALYKRSSIINQSIIIIRQSSTSLHFVSSLMLFTLTEHIATELVLATVNLFEIVTHYARSGDPRFWSNLLLIWMWARSFDVVSQKSDAMSRKSVLCPTSLTLCPTNLMCCVPTSLTLCSTNLYCVPPVWRYVPQIWCAVSPHCLLYTSDAADER